MNLMDLFDPDLVALGLRASNRGDVFMSLTDMLLRAGVVADAGDFVAELERREAQFSTGVGDGMAIPHGKSETVSRAAFVIATLERPLQWDEADDEEVRLVVMLAVPSAEAGSTHVRMLSALAGALMDEQFRDRLMSATTVAQVRQALADREGV